jgi:hypothetical protein
LVRAPPTVSIDFDENNNNERTVTDFRSPSEAGTAWASAEEVAVTMQYISGNTTSNIITKNNDDKIKDSNRNGRELSLEGVVGEHRRISQADPLLKFGKYIKDLWYICCYICAICEYV